MVLQQGSNLAQEKLAGLQHILKAATPCWGYGERVHFSLHLECEAT